MTITSFTMIIGLVLSVAAIGQKPEALIKKAAVAPIIDGQVDAVWAEANIYNISKPYTGHTPTLGAEGETTWRAIWMNEGIYVLVQVNDDAFFPKWADSPAGQNDWYYDLPELYFDINSTNLDDGLGASDGKGHHLISPGFTEGKIDGSPSYDIRNPEVLFAHKVSDPAYVSEYFIPFTSLTDSEGSVISRNRFGFDLHIRDNDPDNNTTYTAVWANTGTNDDPWISMDDCGIITMESTDGPSQVTEISVSGGVIDEDNGTLQIEAMVLPGSAFNKRVKWKVTDGTGRASINNLGTVTAIADGTVTITALATDGSGLEGSAEVSISNQIMQIAELSIIRNGNFDRMDVSGYPEEWFHNGFEDSEIIEVQDGYLILNPPEPEGEGMFWMSQFAQENFNCNTTSEYLFSFVAWAKESRPFVVDFEDPNNFWTRYGSSDHEYSTMGESEWVFNLGTEPVRYSFYVVFDKKLNNTLESLKFQLGESGIATYIDSVSLINLDDLPLVDGFKPVTSIIISTGEDSSNYFDRITLQLSAEVFPQDATLTDFRWSVLCESGSATIDKKGLLTVTEAGSFTVIASARDGSKITGELKIEVIRAVQHIIVTGEANVSTLEKHSTLQMSALVEPEDASVKEVNWSVFQGTGEASIDADGLLTGLEPGSVIVMASATDQSGVKSTMEVEIVAGVGVESTGQNKLQVYPNPASDMLEVSHAFLNSTLTIFNSRGVVMDEKSVTKTTHRFNLNAYAPGIYFVKSGKQVVKFVK